MRGALGIISVGSIVLGALLVAPLGYSITAPLDRAVMAADHAWIAAAIKADKAGMAQLLDADFTWIDASGRKLDRAAVSQKPPTLPLASERDARIMEHTYGQVAVVQADRGTMHVLRVWVKRPAGWRALIYQEVRSLDAPPTVAPDTGKACENPCKAVPYQPKNADEKDVIESFEALESFGVAHDAKGWGAHVAAEFVSASSNSDKLLDKPTRMTELGKANMSGVAPTPLLSARMFDFPGAIVMTSLQRPQKGKDLQITRVWVKRGASWVLASSYQTSIQTPQS